MTAIHAQQPHEQPSNTNSQHAQHPQQYPSRYVVDPPNALYATVGAMLDEFARAGVRHAVVCPGSRSTPLAMALVEERAIRVWMLVDERSAGYFALGLSRRTGDPVLLVCTSGTAAANLFPAIVEANLSHVALIVLTADRPAELRANGAPQTIDQNRLYGPHVRWYAEAALPEASTASLRYTRTLACRAVSEARARAGGPVHLNLPFREPLVPTSEPLIAPEDREVTAWQGRADGAPFVRVPHEPVGRAPAATVTALAARIAGCPRGLIIAGPQPSRDLPDAIIALARATGYPVLADPLSGVRGRGAASVLARYDAFLRNTDLVSAAAPQLVIRFGAMPTSKQVLLYLQRYHQAHVVAVDENAEWPDPTQLAAEVIHADAWQFCADLVAALEERLLPSLAERNGWRALWQHVEQVTQTALRSTIETFDVLFEGRIFTELALTATTPATLVVGNSMPVRDLDTFYWPEHVSPLVIGNRGANGIDGLVSTALGACAARQDEHTILVLGDLSFYHDLNGLLAAKLYGLHLTVILANNDGGGIFSFLPQAGYHQHFEQLFGTPLGLDFSAAVALYGGRHVRITDWRAFRSELARAEDGTGLTVIEVPTHRETNVELHNKLWRAVSDALATSRPQGTPIGSSSGGAPWA